MISLTIGTQHCSTNSYASFWKCDFYTECTEIELPIGIIIRRGQNWNACLIPCGAAMVMWISYTVRFKLEVVVT